MDAEIISVGTELTYGLTVDTNAAWLSKRLAAIGVTVKRHVTVPDNRAAISDAVRSACGSPLVLISGGLGPTADDLTREALADAVGKPLTADSDALARIQTFFEKLGRTMVKGNDRQALVPAGASVLENTRGTAPGIRVEHGSSVIYALPGVPHELFAMYERAIEPEVIDQAVAGAIVTRTVNCLGASEATVGSVIEDLMSGGREPTVGITAHEGVIKIRVIARGGNAATARAAADADVALIRDRLGKLAFGEEDQTIQEAVGALLLATGVTVATAESCTGGLLGKQLTDVPGSSAFFRQGSIAYANDAKVALLGVPQAAIDRHGAVSEEVARAMAEGCRRVSGADIALSVTGIAGPEGGSVEKPVGLVYIGMADQYACRVRRNLFGGHLSRSASRDRSCKVALNMLRLHLIEKGGSHEPRGNVL